MLELKKELYKQCLVQADERIKTIEQAIVSAHEASVNDTKSSAGDKYETTREMMQQEMSRYQHQLLEAKKVKMALRNINPEKAMDMVQPGSLVFTNEGAFFISAGTGQLRVDNSVFLTISPASPIGRLMTGLRAGNTFSYNKREFIISNVV